MFKLFINYIGQYFDIKQSKSIKIELPLHLSNNFEFFFVKIAKRNFVIAHTKESDLTLKYLIKSKDYLTKSFNSHILFSFESLLHQKKVTLIRNNISFIVIEKQLFIPELAVSLTERKESKSIIGQKFSSNAQYVFLYLLAKRDRIFDSSIKETLQINDMYFSRAIRELIAREIVQIENSGKKKTYSLTSSEVNLWNKHKDNLSNPIINKIGIAFSSDAGKNYRIKSGELRLAEISMLSGEKQVFAIENKNWVLEKEKMSIDYDDNKIIEMEIWNSKIPMINDKINPLALYFSFEDEYNERVIGEYEKILSKVLGGDVEW